MPPLRALLSVVTFVGLAACASSRPPPRVSRPPPDDDRVFVPVVMVDEPPCVIEGDEDFSAVSHCSGVPAEWGSPAPSLRVELVPERLVVRSGERARFTVRLTNTERRPVRLVFNCSSATRLRAADETSDLPSESEDRICPASGVGVDLKPGATLRLEEEIDARRWMRYEAAWPPGYSFPEPNYSWEPEPLPPGQYVLELELRSIPTKDAPFMTVRAPVQVE